MTALVGSVAAVFTAIYYYGFDFEKVGDGVFPPETRDAHDCVSVDGTSKGVSPAISRSMPNAHEAIVTAFV